MNSIPKVSIIVPVYNVGQYLRTSLESIRNQSFTDWEAVLVDDGSTDNSGAICDQYAALDKRFVVIHKENGGVSTARNSGLKAAKGEWITFADADDELPQEAINTMCSGISEHINIVIAGYKKLNELKEVTYEITEKYSGIKNQNDAILEIYNPSFYSYLGYICSKLYRNDIIRKNDIKFDESIMVSEDRLFLLKYLSVISEKAYFTTEPVYCYYVRNGSVMGDIKKNYNRKVLTEIVAMGKAYRMFKSLHFPDTVVNRSRKEILMSGYSILFLQKRTKSRNLSNTLETLFLMIREAGFFYAINSILKQMIIKCKNK